MVPPQRQRAGDVLVEWQRFVESNPASIAMRPIILESWRRSYAAGVAPHTEALAMRCVTAAELERRTGASAALVALAKPHLEWLTTTQGGEAHVAAIVDREGVVLWSTGTASLAETLATPGFDHSEGALGTNGAGSALATGIATGVEASEHFMTALHGLTSAAAPLHAACGEIIGAIELIVPAGRGVDGPLMFVGHAAFVIDAAMRERADDHRNRMLGENGEGLADELRESKARFRGAFDQAAIAMAITHPDGRWIKVNRALCELLGYTERDLLEIPFQTVTHPDDIAPNLELFQRALAGEIDGYQMEKRYIHREGHVVSTTLNVALVRDGDGTPMYFIAQMQDIRERKRAEAMLRESETLYRGLSAAAPVGIFQSDAEGSITYANPQILQIFALTEAEGLGRGWISRVHADDVDAVLAGWNAAIHARTEYQHEYRLLLPGATVRWVHCRAAPLLDTDGTLLGTVGTVEDITARKALEAQLRQAQKMEAVGQLAGGVAHDFNNLLTIIKVHAELAVESVDPAQSLHADLEEIRRAASRAAGLTRQLLAFSRKQVLQPQLLDLRDVIIGLAPMLERLIGEDIDVVTRISPALGSVLADPGQLEQVLVNLAVNARDAMPSGGTLSLGASNLEVTPHEGARRDIPAGHYVILTVTDTGCGMTREVKERIFEPFFTTKPVGLGTGLGLSMVYGIVEQSGGHLWVDSQPGRGTTFTICLPRVADTAATASPSRGADNQSVGAETVLVVEDETGVRRLARRILERSGYSVIEARDGRHALEFAAAHAGRIDLLLTDMVMPEMNGRVLAERLCAVRSDLRVLYMSGYTDDEIVRRGLLDSGTRFLEKPFTADGLASAVRAAIDSTRARVA